ncbi:MAG: hypothetical protein LLG04_07965 [Parachlamydia sp.]|nr:hypothetical protein [Parachlamydia sp.]
MFSAFDDITSYYSAPPSAPPPLLPARGFDPAIREDLLYDFSRNTNEEKGGRLRAVFTRAVSDFLADRLDVHALNQRFRLHPQENFAGIQFDLPRLLQPLLDFLGNSQAEPHQTAKGIVLLLFLWKMTEAYVRPDETKLVEEALNRLKASPLAPCEYAEALYAHDVYTKSIYRLPAGSPGLQSTLFSSEWSAYPALQAALQNNIIADNPRPCVNLLESAKQAGRLEWLNQFIGEKFRSYDSLFAGFIEGFYCLFRHCPDVSATNKVWQLLDFLNGLDAKEQSERLSPICWGSHSDPLRGFLIRFAEGDCHAMAPEEAFAIMVRLYALSSINVRVGKHEYDRTGANRRYESGLWLEDNLKKNGMMDDYLFEKGLTCDEFKSRLAKLHQFLAMIQDDPHHWHRDANTLKALCQFTPRANPAFRLSDAKTFDCVLNMLQACQEKKDLGQALMLIDIFPPEEAERLFQFYQKHRDQLRIDKATFSALPTEEKREWLHYHAKMRTRQTHLASWALKHADNEELKVDALLWIAAVKKELKPRDEARVTALIKTGSLPIQRAAVTAFHATHLNASDRAARHFLIEQFHQAEDALLQRQLLRAIATYQFDENRDQELLEALFSKVSAFKEQELNQAGVFSLMRIVACGKAGGRSDKIGEPIFDRMLLHCKKIVDSAIWSPWDRDYARDNSAEHLKMPQETAHLQYPIPQPFERNRYRMNVALLHLFTGLYPANGNVNASDREQYLDILPVNIYYIPLLHLPDKPVYRALGTKQGNLTAQFAVVEALLSGSFPRDLRFGSHDHGNWSKREEELSGSFFTTRLSMALNGLYHHPVDGALLEASGASMNQELQTLNARMERERSFNLVVFGGRSRYQFERIYLDESWRKDLLAIAGRLPETSKVPQHAADPSKDPAKREELRSELARLQEYLKAQGVKEVFKQMSIRELLELHRHLVKEDFLSKKILFGIDPHTLPASKEPSDENVEQIKKATAQRMGEMQQFRKRFEAVCKKPFCLGQDQMLGLQGERFAAAVPALLNLLSPYGANEGDGPLLCQFSRQAQVEQTEKGRYHLRIFKLALIFRKVPMKQLIPLLNTDFAPSFFGFGDNWELAQQAILDLVSLSQQLEKSPSKIARTLELIAYPECNHSEFKQLIELFTQIS